MSTAITDKIRGIAESVARGYARRCGPYADVRDLTQEAWAICLAARAHFDETRGTEIGCYLHRAAVLGLRDYLLRQAPVSGHREALRGLVSVELDPDHSSASPSPEEQAARSAMARRTRAVVARVVRGLRDSDLGAAVLAGGNPAELARARARKSSADRPS